MRSSANPAPAPMRTRSAAMPQTSRCGRASRDITGAIVNSLTEVIRLAGEVVLGAGIGFTGGLFGISAGAMAITALGLMGLSQQIAQGTSLVMQVPNVAIG